MTRSKSRVVECVSSGLELFETKSSVVSKSCPFKNLPAGHDPEKNKKRGSGFTLFKSGANKKRMQIKIERKVVPSLSHSTTRTGWMFVVSLL